MTKSKEIEAIQNAIRAVAIKDIRLCSLNAKSDPVDLSDGDSEEESKELEIAVKNSAPMIVKDEEGNLLLVRVVVTIFGQEASGTEIHYEAEFEAIYDINDPSMTEEHFSEFGRQNVLFNIWPFARQMFQNLSVQMGISPIVLPLLKYAPPVPAPEK